jgi:3-oxoacyl-[acyl-carrier protein] reductase
MGGFSVKRALVLGGTGSIGSSICRTLVRGGAKVAFTCFEKEAAAKSLAEEIGAVGFARCDFNHPESIGGAIRELGIALGGIDALISAVGSGGARFNLKLGELTADDIDRAFTGNARGVILACQAARSYLAAGNIVVLGSMDGVKSVPSPIAFAAAKSALKGMVESMSKELGEFDIRVNLVVPGIVEGGASVHLSADLRERYLKHSSAKRLARPSEIAEVVSWFALENTYVTGQSILLNGGL